MTRSVAERIYDAVVRQVEDKRCISKEELIEDIVGIIGSSQGHFIWGNHDVGRVVSNQYENVWVEHYKRHAANK